MKIPSINPEKARRIEMLTREMRRETWAMPAIVLGSGLAFGCFGLLASAQRQGHLGPGGISLLYAMLAVFAGVLVLDHLRGGKRTAPFEALEMPLREPTAIVSPEPGAGPPSTTGRIKAGPRNAEPAEHGPMFLPHVTTARAFFGASGFRAAAVFRAGSGSLSRQDGAEPEGQGSRLQA